MSDGDGDIMRALARIEVRTADGSKIVQVIEVTELDHINMKDYLNETYFAVNEAVRVQGFSI